MQSSTMIHPSLASLGGGTLFPQQQQQFLVPQTSQMGSLSQHSTADGAVASSGGGLGRTSSTVSKASATVGKKVKVKQADGTYRIMVVGSDGKAHPIAGAHSEGPSRSPSAAGIGSSGPATPTASAARSPSVTTRKIVKRPPSSPNVAAGNLPPPSPFPQQPPTPTSAFAMPTMVSIPASQAGLTWRDRFTRFYQHHAPDKMEKVETCMTMEAGPQAVMDALENKYGPEPPVMVPANQPPPFYNLQQSLPQSLAASATHMPPLYGTSQNASTGSHPMLPAPIVGVGSNVPSGAATPDPRASSVTSRSPSVTTSTKMVRKLVKKAAPKPSAAASAQVSPPAAVATARSSDLPPMENIEDVIARDGPSSGAATPPKPTTENPLAEKKAKKKKKDDGATVKKPQGKASKALGALLKNLKASSSDSDSDSTSEEDEDESETAEDKKIEGVNNAAGAQLKGGKEDVSSKPTQKEEGGLPPNALSSTISPRTTTPTTTTNVKSPSSPSDLVMGSSGIPPRSLRARSSDSDSSSDGGGSNQPPPPVTRQIDANNNNNVGGTQKQTATAAAGESRASTLEAVSPSLSPYPTPQITTTVHGAEDGVVPTEGSAAKNTTTSAHLSRQLKHLAHHDSSDDSTSGDEDGNDKKGASTTAALSDEKKAAASPAQPSVVVTSGGRQIFANEEEEETRKKEDSTTSPTIQKMTTPSDALGVSASARAALASTPTRRPTANGEAITREREEAAKRTQTNNGSSSSSSLGGNFARAPMGSTSSQRELGGGGSAPARRGSDDALRRSGGPLAPSSSIRSSTPPRGRNALLASPREREGDPPTVYASMPTSSSARERLQRSPGPTPWPLRPYTPDRSRQQPQQSDRQHAQKADDVRSDRRQDRPQSAAAGRGAARSSLPPTPNTTPTRGGSASRRRPPPAVRDAPHIKIVDRSAFSPNIERPPTPDELFGVKRSEVRCPVRIGPPPSSSRTRTQSGGRFGSAQRSRESIESGDEESRDSHLLNTKSSRSGTPNPIARRASLALGDLSYKKMRGDELNEAAKALHRGMKNSKYSYFDGLSADYFSTFPSKSSPQSQRPSPWALSPAGRGNGAVIAGIQKKLLLAKKEEEERSPSRSRGGEGGGDRAGRDGHSGYDYHYHQAGGGEEAAAEREGDSHAWQENNHRRLYTTSYFDPRRDSYAATRGGYHHVDPYDATGPPLLTVADLIGNSRRIIRTTRGLSVEGQTAEDLEAFGAVGGGMSSGKSGAKGAAVGIDSMDGVDEIVFEKEIPPPPLSAGYGSNRESVRRKAQTIVRRDEVVCVLREIPHTAEDVRRQRELSDRLSKPRNLYVPRDVVVAANGATKKKR